MLAIAAPNPLFLAYSYYSILIIVTDNWWYDNGDFLLTFKVL
jgi:hypothetical protein